MDVTGDGGPRGVVTMMMEWYDQIQRDMRLAGRRESRQATFTVVAIACLALGIASTVGAFSVLRPVLLDPMPFEDADRLVTSGEAVGATAALKES